MRFSLKLFLLLSVLLAMLVAYLGIESRSRSIRGQAVKVWRSFDGVDGHAGDGIGGIQFDGNGLALYAEARSPEGLQWVLDDIAAGTISTVPSCSA